MNMQFVIGATTPEAVIVDGRQYLSPEHVARLTERQAQMSYQASRCATFLEAWAKKFDGQGDEGRAHVFREQAAMLREAFKP